MPGDFLHRTAQMVSCGILTHIIWAFSVLGTCGPVTSSHKHQWLHQGGWMEKGTEVWPMAIWTSNLTGPVTSGLLCSQLSWMQQLGSGFTSQKPVVFVCHCPSWGQRHGLATERVSVPGVPEASTSYITWRAPWTMNKHVGLQIQSSFQDGDHRAFSQVRGTSKCGSPCKGIGCTWRGPWQKCGTSLGGDSWEFSRSEEGAGHPWQDSADSVFIHVGFFLLLGTDVPFQWYLT